MTGNRNDPRPHKYNDDGHHIISTKYGEGALIKMVAKVHLLNDDEGTRITYTTKKASYYSTKNNEGARVTCTKHRYLYYTR
jgi:hypothetical protein